MTTLRRILQIDDDLDILTVSKMILEDIGGFVLEQCSSGAEALNSVVLFKPELILLDAMMPEMSGLETLQALKKLPEVADIPVVFLTAKAQPSEILEFMNAGAIGTITKPFDPIAFPDQIRNIWRKDGTHD